MFENLEELHPDPILGLMTAHRNDASLKKIDLGVGVYRDESGATPIMKSVLEAQKIRHETEQTKSYIGPPGTPEFNTLTRKLMFGNDNQAEKSNRIAGVQTPGGCGALRVAAELIKRARPKTTIWVSDPTWANHQPLLGNAGLNLKEYAYYQKSSRNLNTDGLLESLSNVPAGDAVLIHGCCHNPSGVDLEPQHWEAIADLAINQGFTPFIDLAYQGLGDSLDEDAIGVKILSERCPEVIVASSYSKNFGLYRERVGSLQIVSPNVAQTTIVQSQLGSVVRGIYSMPPAHGAAIVETILSDKTLKLQWVEELSTMRDRINLLRKELANRLTREIDQDFSFIEKQKGMFSFLGIDTNQVARLQKEFAIYMVDSSRINVAGVNNSNIDYFVESMTTILKN
jgi:aspartate aminotransferase